MIDTGCRWLAIAAVAACAGPPSRTSSGVEDPSLPNVVLLLCDDLGWGDVGFQGNERIETPHLDAMARGGLRFTRFYAAAPVCSPTRGAYLTGRHPHRYGIPGANSGHMRPEELTLAEVLADLGYATGHFGKWHLGTLTTAIEDSNRGRPGEGEHFAPPWLHGFQRCFSTEAKVPTWDPMLRPRDADNRAWDALVDGRDAEPYGTHYWNEKGEVVRDGLRGDDSRVILDRVIPFVEQAAGEGRPFFAVVWFHTPHLPVVAGPEYAARYPECSLYERNYYGCITAMDEQVGRLRAALRDLGVAGDTLLCFSSDNGPEGAAGEAPGSAGPFRGRKRSLHEGGVRVPGVFEWPGRIPPGETDCAAVSSDVLPTILELCGVEHRGPRPLDGVSLVPVLVGEVHERPQPIGFRSRRQRAWHDGRHKLISTDDGESYALYDLVADPGESVDLAAREPERVEHMRAALHAWIESCERSDRGGDY